MADSPFVANPPSVVGASEYSDAFLLPTGTVTFLLTDVEHSTRSWEAAPEAMAKAINRHYEILGDVVGRHRGVRPVEQGEGDSIVAAFSRGIDAVTAALEAQQRLRAEAWPDDAEITVRMALHTGDAQLRDAFNYFGQTVIRTARLRALAAGGQVLASRATHDLVAESLPTGASWRDLGLHRLKDLGRPEHVFQLCHADLRDDFAPLRGLDASPNNLPAQLTTFIGREHELFDIAHALDENRLVTLTGAGGCGKTRLSLQLAANRVDQHPDGVWYVELASLAAGASVDRQVADVLGAHEDADATLVAALGDHIGDQSMLLVLDNCEHVLDESATVVDELTRRCPQLSVLATSRQVLDVPGEVVWRVPSMAVPDGDELPPIDALAALDAVRLFCERAARGRAGFVFDADNASMIATICRRVDGIPLAIELAAARVRTMGLDEILRGLDDRFRLLTGGGRTLLPRQQTLAASVDWSYDLLETEEQRLLRQLSVFAGSFTLEAADAVSGAPARDGLSALVDRSLVQLDDATAPACYRYLETVKAYGRGLLAHHGEEDEVRDRHLEYFGAVAGEAETAVVGRDQAVWLARLDREHDDLRSALGWASAGFSFEKLLQLVISLAPYWHSRGHSREAQTWFARALAEAPEASGVLRARVLWASAYQALYADEFEFSAERAVAALELAQQSGDDRTTARALDTLATLEQFADPAGAQERFIEAARLAERARDVWCQTDALQKAAYSDFYRDRWPQALELADAAYRLAVESGNRFFSSWHWTLVGCAAWRHGRCDEARTALKQAFDDGVAVGEPMTVACSGVMRAFVELLAGNDDAAAEQAQETAVALGEHANDGFGAVMLGHYEAVRLLIGGEMLAAIETDSAVLEALLAQGVLYPTALFIPYLIAARVLAGQLDDAETDLARTRDMGARLQSTVALALADTMDAVVARGRGRADLADRPARAALQALVEAGLLPDAVNALEVLAGVLLELGNAPDALRLFAAAERVRNANGWRGEFPTLFGAMAARDQALAIEAVGDRADALREEGSRLSLEEAVAYAMRARGTRNRPAMGWASLTPTELQVVGLVAAGRSNPEIAAELFVSRATVKTHVSHALTKLGVATRAELAAEAARHDD